MSDKSEVPTSQPETKRFTARAHIVAQLTREIMGNNQMNDFPIASEHQLCQRFRTSRVTIRLALSDLENMGLIFRKHGKGTFAHGCSTRLPRNIAVFMKIPFPATDSLLINFLNGVKKAVKARRGILIIVEESPRQWHPLLVKMSAGAIVIPQQVTSLEVEGIKSHNLPYFVFGETDLLGPHIKIEDICADVCTEELYPENNAYFAGQLAVEAIHDAIMAQRELQNITVKPASVFDFKLKSKADSELKINH